MLVGAMGGFAAVGSVFGLSWLGTHSPDWLGPAIVLLAIFAAGAIGAISIYEGRR